MPGAPTGTVTFLFTDIEGSTRLWEDDRTGMSQALERHDAILREAVEAFGGVIFSTGGDGLGAAFQRAPDALKAALEAQSRLQAQRWDPPLVVRMAVHTGDVEERGGDYFGPPLNRCARLMAAGHGGQVLCSGITASLVSDGLPEGSNLRDLGRHNLRDLSQPEHVFQLEYPSLRSDFPALRSLDTYRSNLPSQPTAFVGRESQVLEIAHALADARVITLSGVGGVGKTRLALQVAAHVLPRFLDGAWFVELASVGTDEAVEEAVASVLGVQSGPGRALEQAVLDYLRTKSLLLLLDNCEHVLGAVARFVDTALAVAPRLAVLATSREGLAVPGERLLTVPSLQTPDAHMTAADLIVTEAVRLFAERATDTRSSFDLSVDDAPTVGELCRRLGGIPLAIELAAARIGVMTPKEILDHLDRRFKLLTAGRRTAVTRHQTLQSTLDWSHELLEAADRVVFRRLSVFSGDFDLSAVEAIVVGEDLDTFEAAGLLFKLVEKSLVVAQPGSEVTRYRLLETIRDYAWERLVESGEGDDVSCRHCRHYLDLAERLGRDLCGPHELASKMRIEAELGNFRAALRWAVDDGDADTALRLVDGLAIVGSLPSPFGTVPLEAANMPGARGHPLAAVALASAAAASSTQGDHRQAAELVEAAIAAMPAGHGSALDDRAVCHTVSNVAMVAYTQADLPRFVDLARVWLEAARALGDPFEISQALNLLGGIVNDPDEAVDACEGALALARELGNPSRIAFSSISLGTRLGQFDVDRAHAVFEEALAAAVTARNDWVDSFAVQQLALLQARKGDYVRAVRTLIEVAERTTFKGDHFATSLSVTELAVLVASMGAGELALLLGTWAEQHGATYNTTNPAFTRELTGDYEALAQKVSPSDRRLLVQQVATLDAPGVVALARTYLDQVESSTRPTPG